MGIPYSILYRYITFTHSYIIFQTKVYCFNIMLVQCGYAQYRGWFKVYQEVQDLLCLHLESRFGIDIVRYKMICTNTVNLVSNLDLVKCYLECEQCCICTHPHIIDQLDLIGLNGGALSKRHRGSCKRPMRQAFAARGWVAKVESWKQSMLMFSSIFQISCQTDTFFL